MNYITHEIGFGWLKISYFRVLNTLFFILCCFVCSLIYAQKLDSLVYHSLQFVEQQLTNTVAEIGDTTMSPYYTSEDGSWRTNRAPSWISGWFPGCLWYMYQWTSDDIWKKWAESWTASLDIAKTYTNTHDVGFIIFCSFGNGYHITGNETYREVIIEAARSMAVLYDTTIGCIKPKGTNQELNIMIDTMMNLELLLWASKNGGEAKWTDMVVSHSLKSSEDLVRADGSTYQDVYYDAVTGDILRRGNHQGYEDSSTWARGQTWGLYGFTMVYRYTRDVRFLETATKLADVFIDHLPDDHVPYWDFDAPDTLKDVSASATAVSALLELSTLVPEEQAKGKYWLAALDILTSLCSSAYLAEGTNSSGILLHGIQNRNQNKGIDVSLIYADYYFIEALLRYQMLSTSVVASEDLNRIPLSIQLFQNYPNPFNSATAIWYELSFSTNVTLTVYDVTGRLVRTLKNDFHEAGVHQLVFNSERFSSGIYFLVLQAGNEMTSRKMTLIQ